MLRHVCLWAIQDENFYDMLWVQNMHALCYDKWVNFTCFDDMIWAENMHAYVMICG